MQNRRAECRVQSDSGNANGSDLNGRRGCDGANHSTARGALHGYALRVERRRAKKRESERGGPGSSETKENSRGKIAFHTNHFRSVSGDQRP